jgi:hypothetical protein
MYFINLCTAQLFRSLFNNTASLAVVTKVRMKREYVYDQEWGLGKEAFSLFPKNTNQHEHQQQNKQKHRTTESLYGQSVTQP